MQIRIRILSTAHGVGFPGIFSTNLYIDGVQTIEPFVEMFYGTLPLRVDFLRNVYGVPAGKTELLGFGADHTAVNLAARKETGQRIRSELNIGSPDLVLVTGGRLNRARTFMF